MNASEFKKQPRGPYSFDYWRWKDTVTTPVGKFEVEFQMLGDNDTRPPDEEMLRRAAELVHYAETHGEHLLDIVFSSYRLAAESDPGWLEACEVPLHLTRENVSRYLRSDRTLVVSRYLERDEPYDSSVYVVPLWDEEHGLALKLEDDAIVEVNDSPFEIQAGVLRFKYED